MKLHHGDDKVDTKKQAYLGQHYDEASGSLFSGESSSEKDSPSEENMTPDEGSSYYSYDTEYENPPMKHKVAEDDSPDTDMQL